MSNRAAIVKRRKKARIAKERRRYKEMMEVGIRWNFDKIKYISESSLLEKSILLSESEYLKLLYEKIK